jgi:hypothetical protein
VASPNSIVNLLEAKVLTKEYIEEFLRHKSAGARTEAENTAAKV